MSREPITVPIPPACCAGWFFEHTAECPTPGRPRPCSDCGADPGTEHLHSCQWWLTDEPSTDTTDASGA